MDPDFIPAITQVTVATDAAGEESVPQKSPNSQAGTSSKPLNGRGKHTMSEGITMFRDVHTIGKLGTAYSNMDNMNTNLLQFYTLNTHLTALSDKQNSFYFSDWSMQVWYGMVY